MLYAVRLILHWFKLDVNLFVQYIDNKSNQWSSSLTVHVCANNRQPSVCVAKCYQLLAQRLLPGDHTRHTALCVALCCRLGMIQHRASIGISRYTCILYINGLLMYSGIH